MELRVRAIWNLRNDLSPEGVRRVRVVRFHIWYFCRKAKTFRWRHPDQGAVAMRLLHFEADAQETKAHSREGGI